MAAMDWNLVHYLGSIDERLEQDVTLKRCIYILESIKSCELVNKLRSKSHVVNGVDLIRKMQPDCSGYAAAYELEREAGMFRLLEKAGLIVRGSRDRPPYGYGDDHYFALTDHARDFIIDKDYCTICRILMRHAYDTI